MEAFLSWRVQAAPREADHLKALGRGRDDVWDKDYDRTTTRRAPRDHFGQAHAAMFDGRDPDSDDETRDDVAAKRRRPRAGSRASCRAKQSREPFSALPEEETGRRRETRRPRRTPPPPAMKPRSPPRPDPERCRAGRRTRARRGGARRAEPRRSGKSFAPSAARAWRARAGGGLLVVHATYIKPTVVYFIHLYVPPSS